MDIFSAKTLEVVISGLGLFGWIAVIFLVYLLLDKKDKLKKLDQKLGSIEKAFENLDEQAKLIVKTDLELNRTQEELDRKVAGLFTLHRIARNISRTFDKSEVFNRIEDAYLQDLGFDKVLICILEGDNFKVKASVNYPAERITEIIRDLLASKNRDSVLSRLRQNKTVSKTQDTQNVKGAVEEAQKIFGLTYFVVTPVSFKEELVGFIAAGSANEDYPINEGDSEIVKILSTQIGEALENAQLFEETWKTSQELETKVKLRTKELSEALLEIRQVSKRKSDFISAVSHELRTPLTSIKGYASILLTGKLGDVPEKIKERLEKINHHSDELTKMINDLLDISRIESGKTELKVEPLELKDLLAEIVDLLSPQLKEKQLLLSIGQSLPAVKADRSQLNRIFINLIGNAIKFTPSGGRINIEAKVIDQAVQIDVADSGVGVPEKDLPHIFDEFYRSENAVNQNIKGTGLGLSLVKYIIAAHNGKIWAKSSLGKGTTVSFTLDKV